MGEDTIRHHREVLGCPIVGNQDAYKNVLVIMCYAIHVSCTHCPHMDAEATMPQQ